jgi:hypothetical protein
LGLPLVDSPEPGGLLFRLRWRRCATRWHGSTSWTRSRVGRLEGSLGDRDAALAAARRAIELVPAEKRDELRADMREHPKVALIRDEL